MAFIDIDQITKHFVNNLQPAVDQFTLSMDQGEIITLLGPSGCGKTTTLRMIAGFEQPSCGSIKIDGITVYDYAHTLPPEKRGIGMVFQDYALFPHLTIEKNVTFGLAKWRPLMRKERAREVLELVGLYELRDRYPHQLSGGQQQRVALARALAPRPKVVLMDEPFSNLDAGLRERMRHDVTTILRKTKTTAIIVTHDQKDALAVSDRVVVMNEGIIQQIDHPRDMYRCPRNCFVARFLGKTNILTGKMASDCKHVFTRIGKVCLPSVYEDEVLDNVTISIRPEGCRLAEEGKGRFIGNITNVTYSGEYQELEVMLKSDDHHRQPMMIYAPIDQNIEVGQVVTFDITPELVALVEN